VQQCVTSAKRCDEGVSAAMLVGHHFALDLFISLSLDLSISPSFDLSISLSLDLSVSLALDLSFASGRMVST